MYASFSRLICMYMYICLLSFGFIMDKFFDMFARILDALESSCIK